MSVSENDVEMLPAIPGSSSITFPGDYTPVQKMILQNVKISQKTEIMKYLLDILEDDIYSSLHDVGYSKLIEMEIKTNPNLASVAFKPYTNPLKCQAWVRKELEYLEKAGIIERSLSFYISPIVTVPRKCPPGSPIQELKRLCVNCRKVSA